MPRGDGTGPFGEGPMTGRGMGVCAGYALGGYARPRRFPFGAGRGGTPWGGGRGRVWGGGFGRGYRCFVNPYPYEYAPENVEDEKQIIADEIKGLESRINDLKKYLADIEKEQKK